MGWCYLGTREYAPRTARWLQRDPIDVASGDPNLYRYCGNDPINHVDANGLTWYYDQRTGAVHWDDPSTPPCDFVYKGTGFSGRKGPHRNNPDSQHLKKTGPIPAGRYTIGNRRCYKSDGITPLDNFPLTPNPSNNMYGRSEFLIHGGSAAGDPSQGCIIVSKALRDEIEKSQDRELVVYDSQNPNTWTPEMWDCLVKLEALTAPSPSEGNALMALLGFQTASSRNDTYISLTFIGLIYALRGGL